MTWPRSRESKGDNHIYTIFSLAPLVITAPSHLRWRGGPSTVMPDMDQVQLQSLLFHSLPSSLQPLSLHSFHLRLDPFGAMREDLGFFGLGPVKGPSSLQCGWLENEKDCSVPRSNYSGLQNMAVYPRPSPPKVTPPLCIGEERRGPSAPR